LFQVYLNNTTKASNGVAFSQSRASRSTLRKTIKLSLAGLAVFRKVLQHWFGPHILEAPGIFVGRIQYWLLSRVPFGDSGQALPGLLASLRTGAKKLVHGEQARVGSYRYGDHRFCFISSINCCRTRRLPAHALVLGWSAP
jgi:hypothetical protein